MKVPVKQVIILNWGSAEKSMLFSLSSSSLFVICNIAFIVSNIIEGQRKFELSPMSFCWLCQKCFMKPSAYSTDPHHSNFGHNETHITHMTLQHLCPHVPRPQDVLAVIIILMDIVVFVMVEIEGQRKWELNASLLFHWRQHSSTGSGLT